VIINCFSLVSSVSILNVVSSKSNFHEEMADPAGEIPVWGHASKYVEILFQIKITELQPLLS
jgi:hypothetical protein